MSKPKSPLYPFLSLTEGSWRNAFFIECHSCPYGREECRGYLLTTDMEGSLVLLSVPYFENATGERVDKTECAAVISREAFERLFCRRLAWEINDPKACTILQLIPNTQDNT